MTVTDAKVGIPWYRKRDYERIRALMADRAQLPRTYESWRMRAEVLEQRLRDTGKPTVRMTIDPKEFARWCASHRIAANAQARLLYIDESVRGHDAQPRP